MDFSSIKSVYLIGIGGIGMSALARYFNYIGKKVAGYDRIATKLTSNLVNEGIDIHFDDDVNLISDSFKSTECKDNVLVIYTPAIPKEHKELNFFRNNSFKLVKRAEVLGLITKNEKTIAISGTHGKTTTTTLTAHVLLQAHLNCVAFLGGISNNYKNNFLLPSTINKEEGTKQEKAQTIDYAVVEADEFDRSFLQLSPYIAVVTSVDADHLDIYGDKQQIEDAFCQFIKRIRPDGKLIIKKGVNIPIGDYPKERYTYSLNSEADFYAKNFSIKNGLYNFDIVTPDKVMEDVTLGTHGLVNVENAIAAAAIACLTGIDEHVIKDSLKTFAGVERRFDFQIQRESLIYIDDYAHHPEELKAFIMSVRDLFPVRKLTGIFQPHLYSRTRDFADEFAKSLEYLDELILLEIYPAREEPIEGVTSKMVFDKVNLDEKHLCEKDKLIDYLIGKELQVLLTIGAGDIDKLVKPIKELLENKAE